MKSLHTALLVGAVSAIVAWGVVFAVLYEPNPRTLSDGSFLYVTDHGPAADMTALLWAAGTYVLTFTPTFLLQRGQAPKDAFSPRQSNG